MNERVLEHAGGLLDGLVHNLKTPLVWIMGRAHLLQERNRSLERLSKASLEDLACVKSRNEKDLEAIVRGVKAIDQILHAFSYKIQMSQAGPSPLELKDYLANEMDFMLADLRFKHDTKLDLNITAAPSAPVVVDYNDLSWAVTRIISLVLQSTAPGRSLRVSLDAGVLTLACPEMTLTPALRAEIESACRGLVLVAVLRVESGPGCRVVLDFQVATRTGCGNATVGRGAD